MQKPGPAVRSVSESSDESGRSSSPGFNRFARDSSRQSLTGQNVLKWASAQERQQDGQDHIPAEQQRALQIQTDLQKVGSWKSVGKSCSNYQLTLVNSICLCAHYLHYFSSL